MASQNIVDRGLGWTVMALVASLVGVVLWQVISRYLFAQPAAWTEELARFQLIWIAMLGGAFAYRQGSHVSLDLLPQSLTGAAASRLVFAIHACCALFSTLVLVVGGGALVLMTWELRQYSAAMGLPIAFVYAVIPASGIVICASAAHKAMRAPFLGEPDEERH